jgi:hypothetical protein
MPGVGDCPEFARGPADELAIVTVLPQRTAVAASAGAEENRGSELYN